MSLAAGRAAFCATSFAIALAGCSGGPTRSFTPSPAVTSTPGAPAAGSSSGARLTIVVPQRASGTAARRRPAYVSPSSTTLDVAVNGGAATSYGLTPNSPGCVVQSATLSCTFQIVAPAGQDSFALSLLDAAGRALSRNVVSAQVAPEVATPISVTLDAVPASVAVVPGANAFVDSTVAPYHVPGLFPLPVEIEPLDADGNVIIGPGAPLIDSVAVSSGGAYATVASAQTTDPAAFIVRPVGGAAGGRTIAVAATVHGLTLGDGTTSPPVTASTTFTFTPALAIESATKVYAVSIESGTTFAVFGICPGLCGTTIGSDLATDSDGNMYVSFGTFFGASVSSQISLFPSTATAPSTILGSSNGVHSLAGIYVDSKSSLWVANGNTGSFFGGGVHTPPSIGRYAPLATSPNFSIPKTFAEPGGIAVDSSGDVFESDPYDTATIVKYPNGSATVSATLSDPSLGNPTRIAADASGGIYVVDALNNDIAYFAHGSSTLTTTLGDSSFANGVDNLLIDPSGNLWVSLGAANEIERLSASALPNSVAVTEIIDQGGAMGWIP
jgi:hypothetical protein